MAMQPPNPDQNTQSETERPGMGHLPQGLLMLAGGLLGALAGSQYGAMTAVLGAAVGTGGGIAVSHVVNSIFKR